MRPVDFDARHYDGTTIALHWITVALVGLQWVVALSIDLFPRGPLRVDARSVHIVLGAVLGLVLAARIAWRATAGRRLAAADRGALHALAKSTHWGLYLLLACTVAAGLFTAWVRGDSLFGLFALPEFDPGNKILRHQVQDIHEALAIAVLLVGAMHAAAAGVHHFWWRDGVLRRMLPDRGGRARARG